MTNRAGRIIFDLGLFLELNNEYGSKPTVPRPRQPLAHDAPALLAAAEKRAEKIDELIEIRGKRVLEVGCGRGDLCYILAKGYGCDVVGVDVISYED